MTKRRGLLAVLAATLVACGSRTDLDLVTVAGDGGGHILPFDAGIDAGVDAGADAAPACSGSGASELTYMLDSSGVLYRYDNTTAHVTPLGTPNCANDNVQWTMTASAETAYIVYTDWTLYAVDLTTLACSPTPFDASPLGIEDEFGVAVMGRGADERLFVYGEDSDGNPILASSDLTSFVLTKVGDVQPVPPASSFPVNLTADTAGHLYAYSPDGYVQEIDASTGKVIDATDSGVMTMSTWASFTLGNDLFLVPDSHVDGYDLATRTLKSSYDIGVFPVGANSVVPCR